MLINLLKHRFNSFTGEKILQMGGRGVSEGKPCELLTPPTLINQIRADDFRRRIFRHDRFCKAFADFPFRLCRHPPTERRDHTQHPLEAPRSRTAGIDIGHESTQNRAGSSSYDRAYVFPPSLADASRRFCFAQQVGAVKTFVLIDPYKFFSNAKRSSEPDSDDLIHVFLTEK